MTILFVNYISVKLKETRKPTLQQVGVRDHDAKTAQRGRGQKIRKE